VALLCIHRYVQVPEGYYRLCKLWAKSAVTLAIWLIWI